MATRKAAKKIETVKNTMAKTEPEKTSAVVEALADDKVTSEKQVVTKEKEVVEEKVTAEKKPVEEKKAVAEKKPAEEKKAVAEKKPVEGKKAAAEKKPAAEKKTPAKNTVKSASAKKEMKVKTVVEYSGRQVDEKDIIANVKKAWTRSGKKVGDIKSVDLYIKPEESAVYYVINKTETGAVAF